MKRKSFDEYRKKKKPQEPQNNKPRPVSDQKEVAAHELGHVITHITTERYFGMVWVRGVHRRQLL